MHKLHLLAAALLASAGLALSAPAADAAVFAQLHGNKETGPQAGDPDGSGAFAANRAGSNRVCYSYSVANIGTPVAAHIHRGAVGKNGDPVLTLKTAGAGSPGGTWGCVTGDPALIDEIAKFPSRFYVNVHTSAYANGAVRGQLFKPTGGQNR